MAKGPLRTRSLGTKLTEVEYASVESAALRDGIGLSEWSRRAVLEAAGRDESPANESVLLAELLSLRAVLLNVMFRLATYSPRAWSPLRPFLRDATFRQDLAERLRDRGQVNAATNSRRAARNPGLGNRVRGCGRRARCRPKVTAIL